MTPFDLHVLGTPPAFVLSQDQTLNVGIISAEAATISFEILLLANHSRIFVG